MDLVGDKTFYQKDNIDVETIFNDKYLGSQWKKRQGRRGQKRIIYNAGTVYLRPGVRSERSQSVCSGDTRR